MDAKKVPQKKQMKIVKKPYVTGSPVDQHTAKEAAKTFLAMLVMMLAFLLLSSMLLWDNLFLRILTNGVVLLGAWGLFYANGMSKGATAVNSAYIGAAAMFLSPNRVVCMTRGMVMPPHSVTAAARTARNTKSFT